MTRTVPSRLRAPTTPRARRSARLRSESPPAATLMAPHPTSDAAPLPVRLLGSAQVEAVFDRSARTIRAWVQAEHLPAVRVGGAVFFREDVVDALLATGLPHPARPNASADDVDPAD